MAISSKEEAKKKKTNRNTFATAFYYITIPHKTRSTIPHKPKNKINRRKIKNKYKDQESANFVWSFAL